VRLSTTAVAILGLSALSCGPGPGGVSPRTDRGRLSVSFPTLSGSQFDTLINGINWVDGYTRNRCTNAACTTKVAVQIDANESSFTIDSVNPGVNGILVARVRNLGSDTTYMYHFKPAPYRYYFLVKRYVGGPTRWVLLQQIPGSAPDSVDSGPFRGCWDHPPATSARADFRNCGPRIALELHRTRVTSFAIARLSLPEGALQGAVEAGGWIGCAYGCCPVAY
jgi:hypothetical protein